MNSRRALPSSPLSWLCALLSVASFTTAQDLPSPYPPTNPTPIVYCPPERLAAGPPAAEQRLNVFLPPGAAPATGWPVVLVTGFGGGAATPAVPNLQNGGPTRPYWELVSDGLAVVFYGVPGVGGGQGMWYPAGHPSGRYESFAPADDNPEKCAEWAVQWLKVQTQFDLDVERIGMRGSSGGAVLAVRTCMGPDRAKTTGSEQVRASTRIKAILAIQPPTSVWALDQSPTLTIGLPDHLERAAQPGVPADFLSQVDETLQKDYSLMRVLTETAEARANNASQAICMIYGDPVLRVAGEVATFDLDASGFPILHDAVHQPYQHDGWYGYMFWKRLIDLSPEAAAFHTTHSVFAMKGIHALPPPLDLHTITYGGSFSGAQAWAIGHQWLVDTLTKPGVPPTDPDLGDPGFEGQQPGLPPTLPWVVTAGLTQVLSTTTTSEVGLPGDGTNWAALSSAGTSATTPPSNPGGQGTAPSGGAGLQQAFRFPAGRSVLLFEAAFLPGPAGPAPDANDWMSVDVSDGATTHNLYFADTFTPTPMTSERTSSRMTAVRTVGLDLRTLFPGADETTDFVLSAAVGNGGPDMDPSVGYVDAFRFVDSLDFEPYGCGVNPARSLVHLAGDPTPGTTLVFGVDDPGAHTAPNAIPFLGLSLAPAPGFPCGVLRAGYGMDGGPGELLVNPGAFVQPWTAGARWQTPGQPAAVTFSLPPDATLIGVNFFIQGLLFDPSAPPGQRVGLGGAVRTTIR